MGNRLGRSVIVVEAIAAVVAGEVGYQVSYAQIKALSCKLEMRPKVELKLSWGVAYQVGTTGGTRNIGELIVSALHELQEADTAGDTAKAHAPEPIELGKKRVQQLEIVLKGIVIVQGGKERIVAILKEQDDRFRASIAALLLLRLVAQKIEI